MARAHDAQHGEPSPLAIPTGVGPACPIFFSVHGEKAANFLHSTIPVADQGRQGDSPVQIKALFTFPGVYGEEVTDFLPEYEKQSCAGQSDREGQCSLYLRRRAWEEDAGCRHEDPRSIWPLMDRLD